LSRTDSNGELVYKKLVQDSIQTAHWMFGRQSDATLEELAVELMVCTCCCHAFDLQTLADVTFSATFKMVGLMSQFAPSLTGYMHVQTNPKWSYSTEKTIKNAESR
jgi:transaldolase